MLIVILIASYLNIVGRKQSEKASLPCSIYPATVRGTLHLALDGVVEVMVQDLAEHYVSQTRDLIGKKVAIELKDTVSNIF
jgi:hypothetical protein